MGNIRYLSFIIMIFLVLLNNANCGGTDTANTGGGASALSVQRAGAATIKMSHSKEHVFVNNENVVGVLMKFRKIDIHSQSKGWFTAADYGTVGKKVDLMSLRTPGDTQDVAYLQLELGTYDQVRFYIFEDDAHVIIRKPDGILRKKELSIAEEDHTVESSTNDSDSETSELKTITFTHEYTVTETGLTSVTVDFNVKNSLRQKEDHEYRFQPDIKLISIQTTAGASRLIRAAYGGTVEILDTVSIDIPPGALSADTVISVIPTDAPVQSTTGKSRSMSLSNYVFLPENVPLITDATVTMHYDPTIFTALNTASGNDFLKEELLDIQYFDTTLGHYVSAGRTLDKVNHTVQAQTRHFSDWDVAINIIGLTWLADRALSWADWNGRANEILRMGQDWNTTNLPTGYTYNASNAIYYPDLLQNPVPPGATGKYKYNPYVQGLWDSYAGRGNRVDANFIPGYYPPNSTDAGTPMDPILFIVSMQDEVPGYASANISGLFYVDVTFGAYIFFHAAQKHDRCDNAGYGTYRKDYSVCNQDFYTDMKTLCDKFTASGSATLWNRCMETRDTFKEAVDLDFRMRVAGVHPNGRTVVGNVTACDDYEGAYGRPVSDKRFQYCTGTGNSLNTSALGADLGIFFPGNVTLIGANSISKECGQTSGYPIFADPRLVLKWQNPSAGYSKINIYRLDAIPTGTDPILAWADSLWKVIDTFVFGQYFYVQSALAAHHVASRYDTRWDDQFEIQQATYEYYIKTVFTFTRDGQTFETYSESPLRATGKNEPVTLRYKSAELLNVCAALTHNTYYPDWYTYRAEY